MAEQQFYDFVKKDNFSANTSLNNVILLKIFSILLKFEFQIQDASTSNDTNGNIDLTSGKNAYDVIKLVEFPAPSPLTKNLVNSSNQQKSPQQPKPSHELAEFEEHGKNVFDVMELRCIDEKTELEQLLNSWALNKQ